MRVLLITGKGGVDKTTVAAATALRPADLGYRTLVMSTDPANSLEDAFALDPGDDPSEMFRSLWPANRRPELFREPLGCGTRLGIRS